MEKYIYLVIQEGYVLFAESSLEDAENSVQHLSTGVGVGLKYEIQKIRLYGAESSLAQ